MRYGLILGLLTIPAVTLGQTRTATVPAPRSTANVVVDPPVLAVGNDLLAQDLIRSCATEIRDAVSSRRANGEKDVAILDGVARNAMKVAATSRADANDSYALYRDAVSGSANESNFALGACFFGRRLRQLTGASLNIKPWVGKYNSGRPAFESYISPTKRGCLLVNMSTPVLADGGNTYRLNVTLRNTCATDLIVIAARHGSLKKLETADWRIMDREYMELREPPTLSEWPEWKGPLPTTLGFVPLETIRAKPRPIPAGQTVRIPYVYDVRAVFADYGSLDVYAAFCPALSSDGYYQYAFLGEWDTSKQFFPVVCKPNVEAGRFVRR